MSTNEKWQDIADKLYEQHKGKPDVYAQITNALLALGYFYQVPYQTAKEKIRARYRHIKRVAAREQPDTAQDTDDLQEDIDAKIDREIAEYGVKTEKHKDGSITRERLFAINNADDKDDVTMMRLHGYDPNKWELINSYSKIWNAYSKKDGRVEMYSSKVTVKPLTQIITPEFVKELWDDMLDYRKPPCVPKIALEGERLAMFSPFDPHFGKLAWGPESGESYDHKIARQLYLDALYDFIAWVKPFKPEMIIFPWSQDFVHVDNESGTTSGGTPQDVDGRTKKIVRYALETLLIAIDELKEIAPVRSFYTRSNHAELIEYCLSLSLECRYLNDQNVCVTSSPSPREYIEYGNSLIGFSHGEADDARIPFLMQTEDSEAWGRTKYHDWYTGHLHKKKKAVFLVDDEAAVTRYWLPSITSADAWHAEKGYKGAIKATQSFVYSKKYGMTDMHEFKA